jgi:integrase
MARRRSNGQGTMFRRKKGGPWIACWYDHSGKRRERSTRTTDKAAAERILAKHVADSALRRDGVIDVRKDHFSIEARKPLDEHIACYLDRCRHADHSKQHIAEKECKFKRLRKATGATRLSDLSTESVSRFLRDLRDKGYAPRTVNFHRQIYVAFMNWCCKTSRLENNPLRYIPKLDESKDRRRIRRPLSDEEVARLMAVAEANGRKAWYMAAVLAGLRRGDLKQLTWEDIDFENSIITIREGKSGRLDQVPMHPQLAEEFKKKWQGDGVSLMDRVFPQTVTDLTRKKDFFRAGLARKELVTDEAGNPVMIGKGKRRRHKMVIVVEDEQGRVIDLHAMRTTLGTNLARAGVAPQLAQKIMRHADYRTTLKHYTVLGLVDTTRAIKMLPGIGESSHQLKPQQLRREKAQIDAKSCETQGHLRLAK